jgi:hypothetical protein
MLIWLWVWLLAWIEEDMSSEKGAVKIRQWMCCCVAIVRYTCSSVVMGMMRWECHWHRRIGPSPVGLTDGLSPAGLVDNPRPAGLNSPKSEGPQQLAKSPRTWMGHGMSGWPSQGWNHNPGIIVTCDHFVFLPWFRMFNLYCGHALHGMHCILKFVRQIMHESSSYVYVFVFYKKTQTHHTYLWSFNVLPLFRVQHTLLALRIEHHCASKFVT